MISIILVAPQMGENIGAAARAMKNFGLWDLRIVAPRDGWPNGKAVSTAAGGADIIRQARIFPDIELAISDLSFIYASTGTPRNMNKDYVLSRNLSSDMASSLTETSKVGILFGRESSGLDNREIAYANKILVIDTIDECSSLNIAHAVAIICYELFGAKNRPRKDLKNKQLLASREQLEHFYEHLFSCLEQKQFFRVPEKKEHMSNKIRNLLTRIDKISESELQTLRGIITVLTSTGSS